MFGASAPQVTACTCTCSLAQIPSPVKITVYLQVNPDFQSWESSKSLLLKFFFSLQIMEAMALHLESSYEKLYRWSQGMLFAVIILVCIATESLVSFLLRQDSGVDSSTRILVKSIYFGINYNQLACEKTINFS